MREVRQAIVLVDGRRPHYGYGYKLWQRSTSGRYRVGAKTEKEAEELVRKAVGFGSVKFYYWESKDCKKRKVGYKEVVHDFTYEPARHACCPQNRKEN